MDEAAKKQALRMIPYGLYVGGAQQEGQYHAFLLSWFSQCSFKPPLVMAGLRRESRAHAMVMASKAFSVNFLDPSQKPVAATFLKHAEQQGDTLSGHRFAPGKTGCPVLEAAAAWLECKVVHSAPLGDHTVVVAEVVEAGARRKERSLNEFDTGWAYGG